MRHKRGQTWYHTEPSSPSTVGHERTKQALFTYCRIRPKGQDITCRRASFSVPKMTSVSGSGEASCGGTRTLPMILPAAGESALSPERSDFETIAAGVADCRVAGMVPRFHKVFGVSRCLRRRKRQVVIFRPKTFEVLPTRFQLRPKSASLFRETVVQCEITPPPMKSLHR